MDAQLQQAAGSRAMSPLREVLDDYLSTGKGRHQKIKGGDWKGLQLKQQRATLARCTRGHEDLLALSVDRAALDRMRAASGTPRTRGENATALRGLLRWGYAQGYFSAEQSVLLPVNVPDIPGTVMGRPAPTRRRRDRAVGQHPDFIAPEDAPSIDQLCALRGELGAVFPAWGELAVEFAADAGPRWGEQFQLTADDVRALVGRAVDKPQAQAILTLLESGEPDRVVVLAAELASGVTMLHSGAGRGPSGLRLSAGTRRSSGVTGARAQSSCPHQAVRRGTSCYWARPSFCVLNRGCRPHGPAPEGPPNAVQKVGKPTRPGSPAGGPAGPRGVKQPQHRPASIGCTTQRRTLACRHSTTSHRRIRDQLAPSGRQPHRGATGGTEPSQIPGRFTVLIWVGHGASVPVPVFLAALCGWACTSPPRPR